MNKINLIVLENQGFCFGVTRAIKLCEDNLEELYSMINMIDKENE